MRGVCWVEVGRGGEGDLVFGAALCGYGCQGTGLMAVETVMRVGLNGDLRRVLSLQRSGMIGK